MLSAKRKILVAAAALCFLALFLPVNQQRILSQGTDKYKAHYALYGKVVKSQIVVLDGQLNGVGTILVNLRHATNLAPANIAIQSLDGQLLTETAIPASSFQDDMFAWITLPPFTTAERTVRIILSAPQATNDNAVGLRFDIDHPDQLAIALQESVPLWRFINTTVFKNEAFPYVVGSIILALLTAGLAFLGEWTTISSKKRHRIQIASLLLLFLVTVGVRLYFIPQLRGVSGGDPYNYLAITSRIANFQNPFIGDKRLPGYPLVLIPTFTTNMDDIWFMRLVQVMSAGGIVVLLALLARNLKLPWSVQLIAPTLLAFQKDFFLTSLRPEPYTFYALLLTASLVLFFQVKHQWGQLLFGIALGYAAMTRQEGFALAAITGLASLAYWKTLWWKGYLRILIPAFLLVLPFFIYNTVTYGNPTYTPYFEGDRNQIVDSWRALQDALSATWGVIGSLWRPVWNNLVRVSFTSPYFIGGFLVTLGLWASSVNPLANHKATKIAMGIIGVIVSITASYTLYQSPSPFAGAMVETTAGWLAFSIVPFIFFTQWKGVFIAAVLFAQTMIATWIHPFPKHYQQVYALFVLLLTVALLAFYLRRKKSEAVQSVSDYAFRGVYQVGVLVPFFLVALILFKPDTMNALVDNSNQENAPDYTLYRAIQVARDMPGPIGYDQAYEPARLYAKDKDTYYFTEKTDDISLDNQQQWLAKNHIKTLVFTNIDPIITAVQPNWHEVAHYKGEARKGKIAESWVYRVE